MACGHAVEESGREDDFRVEKVAEGLEHPWSLAFVRDERDGAHGQALLTERPGRLHRLDLDSGALETIRGLPPVAVVGQGGLMDVAVHPDYPQTPWIYLTWSAEGEDPGRYATHLGRARLEPDGERLEELEVLHVATPFVTNTGHFGSRIVIDDGYLYVTSGDRRDRDAAQDLASHHGKILRFHLDGTIPEDNPFVAEEGALDAIYSYGHRNPQGLTVHPRTGALWSHEHGQRAGDEVNVVRKGGNHGWPVATHSREYTTGREIGVLPDEHDEVVAPIHVWTDRAFPPSGMAFHHGDAFPEWEGLLLLGALGRRYLGYLELAGDRVVDEGALLVDHGWRIRDVRVHPDRGDVYVLVDAADAPVVRLRPAPGP